MKFNIITIFPEIFSARGGPASGGDSCGYFGASIIKRALQKKIIEINIHNLRDYAEDKHKTVDDTPYGGGAGMVLKVEPIFKAVQALKAKAKKQKSKLRTILFSAKGKRYTQTDAERLSGYDNIILICGRYEGVDERVVKHSADEEISIGDYVLTGGEIPAMILVDSISRLLPGVLGNPDSLKEESFIPQVRHTADAQCSGEIKDFENIGEYPQYTKPEEFNGWKVPKVLLSGNHKEIEEWKKEQ